MTSNYEPTMKHDKYNGKWVPINSGIDFSSSVNDVTITPEGVLVRDLHNGIKIIDKREYDKLVERINRVNNYLDDVLKYNASARLEAVIGVVKDILNEED